VMINAAIKSATSSAMRASFGSLCSTGAVGGFIKGQGPRVKPQGGLPESQILAPCKSAIAATKANPAPRLAWIGSRLNETGWWWDEDRTRLRLRLRYALTGEQTQRSGLILQR
jgi:hypothetical protein